MIRNDVPVLECNECKHQWIQRRGELPKRCPSRKCNSRLWNEDAKQSIPVVNVQKSQVRAVSIERQTVREVASPVIVQAAEYELCAYTEYDQDTGESYGCSLPLGHRMKHKRGAKL